MRNFRINVVADNPKQVSRLYRVAKKKTGGDVFRRFEDCLSQYCNKHILPKVELPDGLVAEDRGISWIVSWPAATKMHIDNSSHVVFDWHVDGVDYKPRGMVICSYPYPTQILIEKATDLPVVDVPPVSLDTAHERGLYEEKSAVYEDMIKSGDYKIWASKPGQAVICPPGTVHRSDPRNKKITSMCIRQHLHWG